MTGDDPVHGARPYVVPSPGSADVDQLYAARADFAVSNASVGANILMNILENKDSVFLSEGMHVFRYPVPLALAGRTLAALVIKR